MKSEVVCLRTMCMRIATGIEQWTEHHEKRRVRCFYSGANLLRLSRLQVWSWRYKLEIDEILSLIVPALKRNARTPRRGRGAGLGISAATLCGQSAETILQQEIERKYAGGEHIGLWRQRERDRQMDVELREETDGLGMKVVRLPNLLEMSLPKFLAEYRKRTTGIRHRMQEEASNPARRRKHYRGNPWL